VRLRPVPPYEPPYDDEPAPRLRLVAPHVEDRLPFDAPADPLVLLRDGDGFARQRTPSSQLPDPRAWAARLIVATLEALAGRRPVQQLMPWTDDAVYAQLSRRLRSRRHRPSGPGVLRSLRICEPADGVVEVCAVVTSPERTRAVAARLEGGDGRWRCTAMTLG
jgi:hypothetical protein